MSTKIRAAVLSYLKNNDPGEILDHAITILYLFFCMYLILSLNQAISH